MMRVVIVGAIALVLVGIGAASAHEPTHVTQAIIRCADVLTEDSAAHIRLVQYGNGLVVYRCTRGW